MRSNPYLDPKIHQRVPFPTATPTWARRTARERLGVEPIEIPGGHCPFLCRPKQLAEALV